MKNHWLWNHFCRDPEWSARKNKFDIPSPYENRELKQQRRQRQRKRYLKINIWEMVTIDFCDYCFFFASFFVDRARCKWTGRSAVEVNIENERFTVVCSRCRENLTFGNFTLSFGRWRQRIVLKCVPHVQHYQFSSFNQSDHCFLASSLPLPSSLLRLSNSSYVRL